jgi:hypothetical protein
MKGIPFWLIAAGVIGYIIYKKKKIPIAAAAVTTPQWPEGISPEQIIPQEWRAEPGYTPPEMMY